MPPSSTSSGIETDRTTTDPGQTPLRRRWGLIALIVLLPTLAAVELVIRRWESPKAALEIVNEGNGPMEDLVVTYGDSRIPVGKVERGRSVRLRMTAGPMGPLGLEFRQKGNPNSSLSIPDYEPRQNLADGNKFVVVVQGALIQRYAEADEAPENPAAPWTWLKQWFWDHWNTNFS